MGVWGLRNFENDDALDWMAELRSAEDGWKVVREALSLAVDGDEGELKSRKTSTRALAAAEVLAAAGGNHSSDYDSRHMFAWMKSMPIDLVELALRAIDRISKKSEYKSLWAEGTQHDKWMGILGDLCKRLQTISPR
jgi:hypothetical protein